MGDIYGYDKEVVQQLSKQKARILVKWLESRYPDQPIQQADMQLHLRGLPRDKKLRELAEDAVSRNWILAEARNAAASIRAAIKYPSVERQPYHQHYSPDEQQIRADTENREFRETMHGENYD